MNRTDLDPTLNAWLRATAPDAPPGDLLERVLGSTGQVRRRPAWWPWSQPVGIAMPVVGAVEPAARLALVAGLVIVSLLAVILAVGANRHVPWSKLVPGLILAAERGELLLVDAEGTVVRRLPTGEFVGGTWSPDGQRIAFFDGSLTQPDLVVVTNDGAEITRLPIPAGDVWGPSWSPDGHRIAISAGSPGRIHVIDLDGDRRSTPITAAGPVSIAPSWSPSGEWIAFRSGTETWEQALSVVRPDGKGLLRLTSQARAVEPWCGFPWTEDSRSIAFSTRYNGVWLVDPDGTNERLVLGGSAQAWCPSLSPDATRMAVTAGSDTGNRISVIALDGTNRITPDGPIANGARAFWSPDSRRLLVNGWTADARAKTTMWLDPAGRNPAEPFRIVDPSGQEAPVIVDWQRLQP
jgi:TolB protein